MRLHALLLCSLLAACTDGSIGSSAGEQGGASGSGVAGLSGSSGQGGGISGSSGQGGASEGGQAGAGGHSFPEGGSGGGNQAGEAGAGGSLPEPTLLSVRSVPWNPQSLDLGEVTALVEQEGRTVFFGAKGVQVVAGGALVATIPHGATWKAAVLLRAADLAGEWVVGLDSEGKLHRLLGQSGLEPISDRYGLEDDKVSGLTRVGEASVFAVSEGLVVADGAKVIRYDIGAMNSLAGGGGKVVGVQPKGVVLFELSSEKAVTFPLLGASMALIDEEGRVVAASGAMLFAQASAGLEVPLDPVFQGATPISALASTPLRSWFLADGELGTTSGVLARTTGLALSAGSLAPGQNGGIWLLQQGAPLRFAPGGSPDEEAWYDTVLPAYAHACSNCHKPGGSSGINLSTYAAWASLRSTIYTRVVEDKNMPPSGNTISETDLAAIAAWCKATP
jgi:mono/diheme cytochrome c family protein